MVLVAYSDSEASDSERETDATQNTAPAPTPTHATKPTPSSAAAPNKLVDRSNPRKIRVALPDTKPENADGGDDGDDGPARKKPRIGGGGAFAGFNSFLPPPKRTNATVENENEKRKGGGSSGPRKVFSLKTGAAPGFDRSADEEMKRDLAFASLGAGSGGGAGDDDETIPKAGSLRGEEGMNNQGPEQKKPEEVVLKGNPMMFKPLSVARTGQKKKKTMATIIPPPNAKEPEDGGVLGKGSASQQPPVQAQKPVAPPAPAPKPKVSLFSLPSEETTAAETPSPAQESTYAPLVYTTNEDAPPTGPTSEEESISTTTQEMAPPSAQTLDYIADDLNLSRSQRRQLFGRNADPSKSRILHFNTDVEYAANQEMAHKELAATQHNPVRAIAPGKHTLQQLVNAASSQKEALEESFATGRRNKKEAGSKYGW
ncbi:PRCC domain-containing protein [Aspergillus lucknowensis]|uniref:Mitotic checkpoint regulator, MAD2B-interacting-domain-containing protein n=1 Tax=Aspergillus lucknowensis TaxID=176173 RepID=A0ABR4M852_9EURO